jgi:hypothetical protein
MVFYAINGTVLRRIDMRYTNCFNYSVQELPVDVWARYNRYLNNYGDNCFIGYLGTLGWFIFQSCSESDVLLWSEVLS